MMRRVTFAADEGLIAAARARAARENRSLDDVIRDWLREYAEGGAAAQDYEAIMKRLSYAKAGGKFTREEMHERGHGRPARPDCDCGAGNA